MNVESIIVGQGLAGSILAWLHYFDDRSFVIFDNPGQQSSTAVGAGIVNPLTGRTFNLSWRYDACAAAARAFYKKVEKELDVHIIHDLNILRSIHDIQTQNVVDGKSQDPLYKDYLNTAPEWADLRAHVRPAPGTVQIHKGFRVDIHLFKTASAQFFEEKGQYIATALDPGAIQVNERRCTFQAHSGKFILWCQGYAASANPFFSYLPFNPSKGEVIIAEIPGLPQRYIYKNSIFLVPIGKKKFWIGSKNAWKFDHDAPTAKGREVLLSKLDAVLKLPYKVIDHKSAIRPTVKHRRPFLGSHPAYSNMFIFNGLGTKGASLGPAMGQMLYNHIFKGFALDPEVSIRKYDIDHRG